MERPACPPRLGGAAVCQATGSIVLCSGNGKLPRAGVPQPHGSRRASSMNGICPKPHGTARFSSTLPCSRIPPVSPAVPRFGNVPAAAGASFCGGRPQAGLHDGRRETVRTGAYGSPQSQQGSWRPSAHAFRAPSGGAVRGSLGRTRRADMHG